MLALSYREGGKDASMAITQEKKSPATKTGRYFRIGPGQISNYALRRRLTFVPGVRPNPIFVASLLRNRVNWLERPGEVP